MTRQFTRVALEVTPKVKRQMLSWANQFNICCFMDSHAYAADPLHRYECLVAAGAWRSITLRAGTAFQSLQDFYQEAPGWLFGHFGFELKAETELVSTRLNDPVAFPEGYFFEPEHLILIGENGVELSSYSADPEKLWQQIMTCPVEKGGSLPPVVLQPTMQKETYLERVNRLKAHIHRGDCYEVNFCQAFTASPASINPLQVFECLSTVSPTPFAAYYKLEHLYLLCASPERYLSIRSGQVWSQPIKGTAARNMGDPFADADSAKNLSESSKEKAENVMVVDLVRNDLSRFCKAGSVSVEELFGIYSFSQVHQMISTVQGEMKEGLNWIDAIRLSFPMGSMTGAPKRKVLELIETYEQVSRGIFSGALGYCTPWGDADFNVVIRSLLYNAAKAYVSYLAGSAITWYSVAEQEYQECLLKAAAIKQVLQDSPAGCHPAGES